MVIAPLLVIGGTELLLRLTGFGFDPHFFKRQTIAGADCYVANEEFGLRFFPRSMARAPDPAMMPAAKPAGSTRIFIFGESAALGDPRPNYGAGRYLEVLLAERFPNAEFEVVNTSMTAINSHVILPIARECARRDGDLWIVYMGNNEMVGPFGAATVFGMRAPPLWLARTQVLLRRFRLGQLLFAAAQELHKARPGSENWKGMEMFTQNEIPPDDPRRQMVYGSFERNLNDILSAGLHSGAKVILSTVAVNLKDCPPFGSIAPTNPPQTDVASFKKILEDGVTAEAQGHLADARTDYERATEMCPQSAEAQFQLATCLLNLTNAAVARPHFLQAVDDDTLPFRADSRINDIIRGAARQHPGDALVLCDAAETLNAGSPRGVSGEELFYEHVHLNPNGNYALAVAWADQVEKILPQALKSGAQSEWISQSECERLLGLTDWNRVSILEEILQRIQRAPFVGRSGNTQRVARLRDEIAGLRRHLTDDAAVQAREVYLSALRRAPENPRLHENYAEFLEARHELQPAIAERKKVCELIPYFYFPFYALGVDLKESGALTEARATLLKAEALNSEQGVVWLELAIVSARQGNWDTARRELGTARRFIPDDPQIPLYLGEVLWKLDLRDEAMASLREAIRLAPNDWQPHYRLASDFAQSGNFSEAAGEYQEALRLSPDNVRTKLGLAAALANLGHKPEALQQLREVLKLEPTNSTALEFLNKLGGL